MDLFNRKKVQLLEKQLTDIKAEMSNAVQTVQGMKDIQLKQAQALTRFVQAPVFAGGTYFPSWDTNNQIQNFVNAVDVYNVVKKVYETTAAVPIYVHREKREAVKFRKRYNTAKQGTLQKLIYRTKSMEDVPDSDPLAMLIENPNDYMTQRYFFELSMLLFLLNGEVFIYKMKTGKERGGRVLSLHIFAAGDTAIKITGEWPYKIIGYDFSIQGKRVLVNVPAEDVIHIKMPNPVYDLNGGHLRGVSPLTPGKKTVGRLDIAMDRGTAAMKNGGLPGIIYLEGAAAEDAPSYEAWKESYRRWIEDDSNANAYMPMAGKAGLLQTGLKMADLALMEQSNLDFKRLCSVYKVSHKLFDQDGIGSENSIEAMIKQLYTNACMPLANVFEDALNAGLAPEFGENYHIEFDFSEIPELQADIQKQAAAIAQLPVSPTGNELREWVLKLDRIEMPAMDEPLVKQGYAPIKDFDDDTDIPPVDENI